MSKKSISRSAPFVAAIVLFCATLACGDDVLDPNLAETEEMETIEEEGYRTREAQAATEDAAAEATRSAELTEIADQPEEEIKATLFAEEACIVQEGEAYSWEYTDFKIEEGSYSTVCKYKFVVRNTSDEDQVLLFYETFDNGSDRGGMAWDKWMARHIGAHDSYEAAFSYTKWDKRTDSWDYATKLLVVRGIPECHWLGWSDDPKSQEIWEAHATPLENPCW